MYSASHQSVRTIRASEVDETKNGGKARAIDDVADVARPSTLMNHVQSYAAKTIESISVAVISMQRAALMNVAMNLFVASNSLDASWTSAAAVADEDVAAVASLSIEP